MSRLVVKGFECLIVLLSFLHHIRFCRRLLLLVLDLDVGSSYIDYCCLVCSTCAGGSCNSNVPFCGMYNTQLRVGLVSFLLPVLSAYIPLGVHTLLVAWLRGSFLRFP